MLEILRSVMKLLVKGKVKEVYALDESRLRFRFTDQISVFDKVIPSDVPRKGESLCRTSAHWFDIAKRMGISTHFITMPAPNEMDVIRVGQPRTLDLPESERKGVMIPLEFICRHYIAGSLWDRLEKGKVTKKHLGFSVEPEPGMKLPEPFFEVTTKFEKFDRPITFEEAEESFGVAPEELAGAKEIILKIDDRIAKDVSARGLVHVDGKKEFAIGREDGELMLIDTFGTADEDRFWNAAEYDEGRCVELSKEYVRQYYRLSGYHQALTEAREKGEPEPPIPPLPDNMVFQTGLLYADLYTRITGQVF